MPASHDKDLYQSFEHAFREHYQSLASYAYSILKNAHTAEDVVQDVFLKVWQNNPDIIKSPQLKFYLVTATRNSCISVLRNQAGKIFVEADEVEVPTEAPSLQAGPEQDIAVVVEKALSLLPPQCLAIFRLSRFGKLTYQQIADELNISVKTVENQMGKALKIMRDYARRNNISFVLLLAWIDVCCALATTI